MRAVIYGAACSLDGYITDRNGGIDWLHFSRDVQRIMTEFWKDVDTILMGRVTWEVAQRMAGGSAGTASGGMSTYLFSRTLTTAPAGTTLVRDNAAEFVRTLRAGTGKNICLMGGGALAASLLAAGQVDEVSANVHPVILGGGTPFLPDPGRTVPLELKEARQLDGGCVLMNYRAASRA